MKDLTGLNDDELKRQLVSLSLQEHQILVASNQDKNSMENKSQEVISLSRSKSVKKTFTPADIFRVNNAFNAKLKRIVVN